MYVPVVAKIPKNGLDCRHDQGGDRHLREYEAVPRRLTASQMGEEGMQHVRTIPAPKHIGP